MTTTTTTTKYHRLLADAEQRRSSVLKKQAELEQEIRTAPDVHTFGDARSRDKEYDRQRDLKMQLQLLHEGRLLYAPGAAYEPLSYLDARIAELRARLA